jgi:hypothetical protein
MENEVYQGLIGQHVGRYWYGVGHWDAEGVPCRVDFNPYNVMERELEHHDVVGFFHTHPNMSARASGLDIATMGAWTVATGKPMVCLIRGADGIKAHWFIDDEIRHTTCWVKQFGRLFVGRIPKVVREAINGE